MSRPPTAGLILAAGLGTRMKSEIPKALHLVAGMPMVELVSRAVRGAGIARPTVVVGHCGEAVIESLGESHEFVWQREQKGTGHAVLMAAEALRGHHGPVLVTPGDTPLLSADTLARLIEAYHAESAQVSMATFVTVEPQGYGRIVRDEYDAVAGIVEDRDATPAQRAILEVNPAVYCFDCQLLLEVVQGLGTDNSQGEVYLTDAIAAIHAQGGKIVAETFDDPDEFMGVNDRWQLAVAARILRLRTLRKHAMYGVTIVDPCCTFITLDVEIEADALIEPMTVVEGTTRIAAGARIGPNAWVKDSE
ncbi:MAG: NTP transferase domain-containing protein, partial [Fimbriimonadaceae bacterium]